MQAVDCSMLYFQRGLQNAALDEVWAHKDEAGCLPYLLHAFQDAEGLLARYSADPEPMLQVPHFLVFAVLLYSA